MAGDLIDAMFAAFGFEVVDVTRAGVPGIDYLDDNADEQLAAHPCMPSRCADCAFTPGTNAHGNPTTRAIAEECVAERHAFWCHKPEDAIGTKTHLCAGWREAMAPSPETPRLSNPSKEALA